MHVLEINKPNNIRITHFTYFMYLTNNTTQCNVYRHGLNKEKDRQ